MDLCSRARVIAEVCRDVHCMVQRHVENIVKDRKHKLAKDKGRGMSIGLGVPFDFNSKVVSRSGYFNTSIDTPKDLGRASATAV